MGETPQLLLRQSIAVAAGLAVDGANQVRLGVISYEEQQCQRETIPRILTRAPALLCEESQNFTINLNAI